MKKQYTLEDLVPEIVKAAKAGYEWRTTNIKGNPDDIYHWIYHPEGGFNKHLTEMINESSEYLGYKDVLKLMITHPIKSLDLFMSMYCMVKPVLDRQNETDSHD